MDASLTAWEHYVPVAEEGPEGFQCVKRLHTVIFRGLN